MPLLYAARIAYPCRARGNGGQLFRKDIVRSCFQRRPEVSCPHDNLQQAQAALVVQPPQAASSRGRAAADARRGGQAARREKSPSQAPNARGLNRALQRAAAVDTANALGYKGWAAPQGILPCGKRVGPRDLISAGRSDAGSRADGAAVAHLVYTEVAGGSNPSPPMRSSNRASVAPKRLLCRLSSVGRAAD